jgi:hypothetical protein
MDKDGIPDNVRDLLEEVPPMSDRHRLVSFTVAGCFVIFAAPVVLVAVPILTELVKAVSSAMTNHR